MNTRDHYSFLTGLLLIVTSVAITSPLAQSQTNHNPHGSPSLGFLRTTDGYTAFYHSALGIPLWVSYKVEDFVDSKPKVDRIKTFKTDTFDPQLPNWAKLTHADYTNSGFDRGHMFPHAASEQGGEAMVKTSYRMTNMCPQTNVLNNGIWKHLEKQVRIWAKDLDDVWVITGPIIGQYDQLGPVGRKKRGSSERFNAEQNLFFRSHTDGDYVVIPIAFFKIIVDADGADPNIIAFIIPHDIEKISRFNDAKVEFSNFIVSIDEVERQTGIDFLTQLGDENKESRLPTDNEMTTVWDLRWPDED